MRRAPKMIPLLALVAFVVGCANAALTCNTHGFLYDDSKCWASAINRLMGGSLEDNINCYGSSNWLYADSKTDCDATAAKLNSHADYDKTIGFWHWRDKKNPYNVPYISDKKNPYNVPYIRCVRRDHYYLVTTVKGAKSLQRFLCSNDDTTGCDSGVSMIYVYIGAGGGGVLLILIIATVCCCRKHGKGKLLSKQNVNNDNDFDGSGGNGDDVQLLDLDLGATSAADPTPPLPTPPLPTPPLPTPPLPTPAAPAPTTVKALHPFAPTAPGQITMAQDEAFTLLDGVGNWWRVKAGNGTEGLVPFNYVEKVDLDLSPFCSYCGAKKGGKFCSKCGNSG